ncbi:MAG: hypothetical protein P1P80_07975 [ANME-2 cluster archaeon]|nr:hypothetical protein [ANME-2 cluster archaeon]
MSANAGEAITVQSGGEPHVVAETSKDESWKVAEVKGLTKKKYHPGFSFV